MFSICFRVADVAGQYVFLPLRVFSPLVITFNTSSYIEKVVESARCMRARQTDIPPNAYLVFEVEILHTEPEHGKGDAIWGRSGTRRRRRSDQHERALESKPDCCRCNVGKNWVKFTGMDKTLLDSPAARVALVFGASVGASNKSSTSGTSSAAAAAAAVSAIFLAQFAARVKHLTLCSMARIYGTLAAAGDTSRVGTPRHTKWSVVPEKDGGEIGGHRTTRWHNIAPNPSTECWWSTSCFGCAYTIYSSGRESKNGETWLGDRWCGRGLLWHGKDLVVLGLWAALTGIEFGYDGCKLERLDICQLSYRLVKYTPGRNRLKLCEDQDKVDHSTENELLVTSLDSGFVGYITKPIYEATNQSWEYNHYRDSREADRIAFAVVLVKWWAAALGDIKTAVWCIPNRIGPLWRYMVVYQIYICIYSPGCTVGKGSNFY